MKHLSKDTEGLLPLIGVAAVGIASILGYNWLTSSTDDLMEMLKLWVIAGLLFIIGLLALMGKLGALPKALGFLIGLGCLIVAGYVILYEKIPFMG
jgi:hypothetical protein